MENFNNIKIDNAIRVVAVYKIRIGKVESIYPFYNERTVFRVDGVNYVVRDVFIVDTKRGVAI